MLRRRRNPRDAFEATGTIVDDIGTNPNSEGIVVRTADGKRIPLVMLMLSNRRGQGHLTALAKERNGSLRARGFIASDLSGNTFVERS